MPSWRLTIDNDTGPDGAPTRVSVVVAEGERCIIGRGKTAQIVCQTGACSREHCAITITNGEAFIEDLGSSNGSWLNGKRVAKPTRFGVGDVVHAGRPRIALVAIEPA